MIKVVFFGTPEFAVPSLQALLNHSKIEVVGVVTQPDKRRGRGSQLIPSPVKQLALDHGLPIWQPKRIKKHQKTITLLQETQADIFVVVAYGQLLSPEILAMPRLGCVNGHGSLLPKYRGAAPIQWCLYHGDRQTGMTTMLMDKGMDTGAMLLKSELPLDLVINAQELAIQLSQMGADLLIETLLKLDASEIIAIPQDSSQATYAPLIQKEDFIIDWNRSAIAIHNQIRGFYPNCFTNYRNQPCKLLETIPLGIENSEISDSWIPIISALPTLENIASGELGTVVAIAKKIGPIIQTGDGYLLLKQVQPFGKKVQTGWDFVNGTRLAIGELLQ